VHCLVFDVETVPDLDLGRRLYDLDGVEDNQVAQIMFTRRRQETGGEFLSLVQHRIIAISVALRTREALKVWSLGEPHSSEKELIERFFDGIEKYSPDLVSWNGSGFDLPVLQYRALRHGVAAPRYWETGDDDQAFRYNNYLNRFHWRHLDLMDVLSGYQSRGRASLEDVAALLGLPGKVGMSGDEVWTHYRAADLQAIRNYCEIDVVNTYLIYLRFELIRGRLMPSEYERELACARECLAAQGKPHFARFLEAWGASAPPGS
jgi:predicted PolB exonuclease-like 3'-5' exonuclease